MAYSIVPATQPRLSSEDLLARIAPFGIDRDKHPVIVAGVRGYYLNSMGEPGKNDRGIYDDALFIHSPSIMAAYNANTDPSYVRKGKGTGAGKGMATLEPGCWYVHKFGQHKGSYLALCQRGGDVTVMRDGDPEYADTGMFGINIHKGSYTKTSSEGCQTIHPDQWTSFIETAVDQAKRYHLDAWRTAIIPYVLVKEA
jgi:lysozyme